MTDIDSRNKIEFYEHLREALRSLYDPAVLGESPLIGWLHLEPTDAVLQLRQVLLSAIESFRPPETVSIDSKGWRIYHILHQRFIGQWSQRKVALNLALSERQLQREETSALKALMNYLVSTYTVDPSLQAQATSHDDSAKTDTQSVDLTEVDIHDQMSIAHLVETDIAVILDGALSTLQSAMERSQVQVENRVQIGEYNPLTYQELLRQAILNVLLQLLRPNPGGTLVIEAEQIESAVLIHIRRCLSETISVENAWFTTAQTLLRLINSTLVVNAEVVDAKHQIHASIRVPGIAKRPILFVDDNSDTLRLYQHYLANTTFQFIGCITPLQIVELARDNAVHCIVLDVLMPNLDGWRALEMLRHDPLTESIPIIVTSILPQEELALVLGAVEFMRKPITRTDLLGALDRWNRPMPKELG